RRHTRWPRDWSSDVCSSDLQGVVRHADVLGSGAIGAWADVHRGANGDARGSSANALRDEFLGDYDYAFATRAGVAAVWNDARNEIGRASCRERVEMSRGGG